MGGVSALTLSAGHPSADPLTREFGARSRHIAWPRRHKDFTLGPRSFSLHLAAERVCVEGVGNGLQTIGLADDC